LLFSVTIGIIKALRFKQWFNLKTKHWLIGWNEWSRQKGYTNMRCYESQPNVVYSIFKLISPLISWLKEVVSNSGGCLSWYN